MKAFWWFKENSIAGMARPGFNQIHWFDMPFDEAVVMGWLGQYSSGAVELSSFHKHLNSYAPRIFKFYDLNEKTGREATRLLENPRELNNVLERLSQRSGFLENISINGDHIHFEINKIRLEKEVHFLKDQGIRRVISLTERHHNKEILKDHFILHHLGIEDLGTPQMDQVYKLAEIISDSQKNNEKIAVHCLAGIGRTSTMLVTSHILMGEPLYALKAHLSKQNPSFVFVGPQGDFIQSVADSIISNR